MATLINNGNINLEYLSLNDRTDLKEVLKRENELLSFEHKKLLSVSEIESKDLIVSKKNGSIDGYAIINFKVDSNNDVNVLIERLEQIDLSNKNLTRELFGSAIFVAIEKAKLNNNKIISSSMIINGKTVNFDITESYIKRNLGNKFNKDAIKRKVEEDEKYKKEREKIKDKVSANTFYNDTGHRFHSNVDEKNGTIGVIENDFDVLSLDERLKKMQANSYRVDTSLDETYKRFEKEKISSHLTEVNTIDENKLNDEQRKIVSTAKMSSNDNNVKIDLTNNIAFDDENKKIDIDRNRKEITSINNTLENLSSTNMTIEEVRKIMEQKHPEWKEMGVEKQNEILELYGFNSNENSNLKSNELESSNKKVKQLLLTNNKQSAFISSIIISFIAGIFSGIFITMIVMIVR